MPRRDLFDDPSRHRFVGNFSSGPLADGALFGLLAGHRDQLAGLLSGNLALPSRARDITEPVLDFEIYQCNTLQSKPACAPGTHRLYAQAKFASNLAIILTSIGLQDDASSQGHLLGGAVATHQSLQFVA